jgi:hypothetical protein
MVLLLEGALRAVPSNLALNRAFGAPSSMALRNIPGTFTIGQTVIRTSALVGIVSGLVVLVGALMLGSKVGENSVWGAVITGFSAIALIGGGVFLVGSLLGLLAGIVAILWRPIIRPV